MASGWVIGIIAVLCIIALVMTYRVLKTEEKKQREYRSEGDNELQRSHEYEKKSLKSDLPNLTWIYIIATIIVTILFVVYLF